jgi:hypothetical protein
MKRFGIYQPVRQAVIDLINERDESEPLAKREADDELGFRKVVVSSGNAESRIRFNS